MNYIRLTFILFIVSFNSSIAQVGIGTLDPGKSSVLDVFSSTKGFLPPRMSTEKRDEINGGAFAEGLIIYNTDHNCINFYNGDDWINLCNQISAEISGISCDAPNETTYLGTGLEINTTYTNGSPTINQKIRVKYIGGNEKNFSSETINSTGVENLVATVASASLDNGDGFVEFIITGTPLTSGSAEFPISFLGKSSIGSCSSISVTVEPAFLGGSAICEDDYATVDYVASTSTNRLIADDLAISGNGNRLVVTKQRELEPCSFPYDNCNGIIIFDLESGNWVEKETILATDFTNFGAASNFGIEISDDGNTIAVMAENLGNSSLFTHVLVFEKGVSGWDRTAELALPENNRRPKDLTLSLSGDGQTIATEAFVYKKNGSVWSSSLIPITIPSLGSIRSVSLSDSGDKLVVSHDSSKPSNAEYSSQEVTVFDYNISSNTWTENSSTINYIAESFAATAFRHFGDAKISGDGKVVSTQYLQDDTGENGWVFSLFIMYKLNMTDNSWNPVDTIGKEREHPYLAYSQLDGSEESGSEFGVSYDINDDGSRLAFGHFDLRQSCVSGGILGGGYVSYFKLNSTGDWRLQKILAPSDRYSSNNSWGGAVSMTDDGTKVLTSNSLIPVLGTSNVGKIAIFE